MNQGEVLGWHYATRQPIRLQWQDGRIVSIEKATGPVPSEQWLAPALFDVQVNGYGGVDFQQNHLTTADLLRATRALQRDGCSQILLTLITDEWPALTRRLARLKQLRDESKELTAAIAGWHLEGPFLSEQPGFHGAHPPALMANPTAAQMRELRALTGSDPLLLTLSPERTGSLEAIAAAHNLGIKISLGHTNASVERLRESVQSGASGFTHLGNGCPRELDRHDNILWRVFETPGLIVGLIPDGIHVSPPVFRLFHRVLESIYYTTDAMAAAGAPPGRYTIGKVEVEVGEDQIVRQPGKTNFAGSALRPIDGVLRAARMLNRPWQELWPHFSEIPAQWIGLSAEYGLKVGAPANFCLLKMADTPTPTEIITFVQGRA